MKLDRIFNPKVIAVIGASDKHGSVGYALMDNLINSEYAGTVYPINAKHDHVHSVRAYKTVTEVPDKIDLAIIATPAAAVPQIIEECGQAGISGAVIISSGFQEIGLQGEKMIEQIFITAKKYGMRIIGPNCLGFMRPDLHLNASFASKIALPGKVAFISQSGALCTAILDWSLKNNVGFKHFVSIGSMVDISFHDLIDYFGQDKDVESILIYMESLNDARKFMSAARAFARTKPIIVLKVGRTSEGAVAAKSHTGSLTGNDAIFDAAFKRAGIIRVDTVVSLFHTAKSLAMQPHPRGNRMAIITNAGGPGIIATDALVKDGGEIAKLSKATIDDLNSFLPVNWSRNNPVDILGDADFARYAKSLQIVVTDPNVDAVLVILTPQYMTNPSVVARELVALQLQIDKTIMATWMGGDDVAEGRMILEKGNIPVYRQPEDAIRCFSYVFNYSKNLKALYEAPATIPHAFEPDIEANRKLIDRVIADKRLVLTEAESKELLKNYDIAVVKNAVAKSVKDAGDFSAKIGFPVVMKILSPDILHKTDVGGVRLNINSSAEAEKAYVEILASVKKHLPKAQIDGIFIEQMIKKRYELLIGCKKDPIFGPAIVFGMGGVAVEVFQDTQIALPPLNMALSLNLIMETKIYKLLKGYRNIPGVDIQSIQYLLYKFAYLVADFPEIDELDINPFAVDEAGGIVLDAKVILDEKVIGKKLKPYSHLVISPYPKEYTYSFKLKNGKKVIIRPIRPEDEPMEAEMFASFSKESMKHRFIDDIKEVTHEVLMRFTHIDYDREIALIAEITEGKKKKMLGVVRLISDPLSGIGEFTVIVADPWHFLGLGNKFTDLIFEIAKKRGVKKINAKYLKSNLAMENIFKKRGFKIGEIDKKTNSAELVFSNKN
ncbi:MAG: Acetyltransferase, GNAT family [Candidatus Falkowbacteria bacterium GW2011_GWC2_38_22]|uniref:Acetyltransferase, GNAT family n=1 Tax=Candidatus Falkowbacteria bacterium GW2011_GWE1_38_31 TaxID=1618638 RepID=A0A0G0JT88_9BACT|nr:MAG: Acetyltransferase, GNAT family [Candidatus Falkowbacteria bacterium GW2011_GWF2_38_1205]KKQ62020.1 MAG: Acetyltransferase, GNAT family [Candidatus Falkowbacteria bacterium GW2011_GWC2_38_22]KKQ63818.1 MAG: Acetyltransferase, GNAT family [Candidatus Falkowbacteria bacterium GW2011_GWF1_38_22]KKQ66075.1 MAG: Acetyltransferase, GNAT family [Candidatus Falkowbacteria bacterium GW2011_GWE2_38_254]KKQ70678.1 MAG: Acetyltransferase, GNAT family [Candidatus Falkowbacteria bacterium GW2011_GWE1_